jgi:hypothetical protein
MTTIAAWPRCRAELACRWSSTGCGNAWLARRYGRPSTPITTALNPHLDHQSNPRAFAGRPIDRLNHSLAHPLGLAAAAKRP